MPGSVHVCVTYWAKVCGDSHIVVVGDIEFLAYSSCPGPTTICRVDKFYSTFCETHVIEETNFAVVDWKCCKIRVEIREAD